MTRNFGRYQALSPLGRGGMGEVWRGVDPVLARNVAIKVLSPARELPATLRAEYRERFFREARAAAALVHPNIVAIHDVGVHDDEVPYLVMEYVDGDSLAALLDQGGAFAPRDAAVAGASIARALGCAHAAGIVHRDVKPANVLRSHDGTVKLMDFGIARVGESSLTQEGHFLGSPLFAAPEQIRTGKVDFRSDLFSLGVTLYTLVTGQHPFRRETVQETVRAIVQDEAPRPTAVRPELGPEWDVVLGQALAKDPAERFAGAAEMADALAAVAEGRALGASPGAYAPRPATVAGALDLVVVEGPDAGMRLRLDKAVEVGRGQGDLALTDPTASTRHCRLEPTAEGGARLTDLGSSNGTFVDGQRIRETELAAGARFRVGNRTTLAVDPRPAVRPAEAPATGTVLDGDGGRETSAARRLAGAPRWVLVVREGPASGERHPVTRSLVIGRDDGDIRLRDPKVSGKHAQIELRSATRLALRDLASANGTWLDGARVREVELKPGDTIRLGSTVLVLELEGSG